MNEKIQIDEVKRHIQCCIDTDNCILCSFFKVGCDKNTFGKLMLNAVQQLEAQAPKWISVEERLPESEVPVLLLYKSGYRVIGYWCDDFAEWDDMSDFEISHPDFWMPLPEPPKEG